MTRVRRRGGASRLTFISAGWKVFCRQARLHTQRPREDAGRSVPPHWLDTYVFSGSDLKSIDAAVAASVLYGAFVSRRRALSEVIPQMQDETSAHSSEFDVQLRLYPDDLLPNSLDVEERIDAFDGQLFQLSNEKPTDCRGELTRLTDLTANRKGVHVARARPRPRSRAPGLCTSLPFRPRQIRQIRQTARQRWGEIGDFAPGGVKPVKSPGDSDSEVTA